MIWTKEQTKALTDRVLSMSKAEQTFVAVNGSERASVRFARNTATTSGATAGTSLAITSSFGKRSGIVTTAQFDDASLQRALRNAEEIAKVSPENPEAMPFLGAQTYAPINGLLRRRGHGNARVARQLGGDSDRPQQEEGGRIGRVCRNAVGDAGRRELARACLPTTASPAPTTT